MKTDNVIIIHPKNTDQEGVLLAFIKALKMKYEIAEMDSYNPEMIKKVEKGRKDYEDGKGRVFELNDLNNLWK
jgi:hypothetical protein